LVNDLRVVVRLHGDVCRTIAFCILQSGILHTEETLSLKNQRSHISGAQTPASFIFAFLLLRTDFKSCADEAFPKLFGG
jgi:hypothetical protein